MKTSVRWVLFCTVLCWVVHVAQAQADNVAPDCSADPPCLALYERAKDASARGDLAEALRLYKLAYEVRADPLLLYSVARVLHKQGSTKAAAQYYLRFLAAPTEDPEPRRKAQEYLVQINGEPKKSRAETPQATAATTESSETASDGIPVYRKWWFWTIIGGVAAAGIITGVAVGVSQANRGDGVPDGVTAVDIRF